MTDQEINIKIAESLRWAAPEEVRNWRVNPTGPDYVHDLDAMRDAEESLTEKEQFQYHQEVVRQTGTDHWGTAFEWRDRFAALHATARQKAVAFLRMKGLQQEHP